jgi:hypothetical protein
MNNFSANYKNPGQNQTDEICSVKTKASQAHVEEHSLNKFSLHQMYCTSKSNILSVTFYCVPLCKNNMESTLPLLELVRSCCTESLATQNLFRYLRWWQVHKEHIWRLLIGI